ncbi:universal stress protein [Catenulispora subtropica]|uniref:Universal stress protein n=1 Tax=Catenulispora subtropica TaxID=450798 RepID=A0ABN2TCG0_9ACTN
MKTTVVVGYDRTEPSDAALAEAAREAVMRGAALDVVTAFRQPPATGPNGPNGPNGPAGPWSADLGDLAYKTAFDVAQHGAYLAHERYPHLTATPCAVSGPAGSTVAQAARGAGLLVVGSRGHGGFAGLQLGSTSMRALADATCPVLVVRGREDGRAHDRVVAAVDIDGPCEQVLDFAFDEASRRGTRLTVVHVWDEPWIVAYGRDDPGIAEDIALIEAEREERLLGLVHTVQPRHPEVRPYHQVATGSAGRLLVEATHRADLLVTGARRHSRGRQGLRLGPVTQTLLHHAGCPVAVVPLG